MHKLKLGRCYLRLFPAPRAAALLAYNRKTWQLLRCLPLTLASPGTAVEDSDLLPNLHLIEKHLYQKKKNLEFKFLTKKKRKNELKFLKKRKGKDLNSRTSWISCTYINLKTVALFCTELFRLLCCHKCKNSQVWHSFHSFTSLKLPMSSCKHRCDRSSPFSPRLSLTAPVAWPSACTCACS